MPCDLCGKHAVLTFKGIANNLAMKLNLCESCAKKNGMVFPFGKAIHSLEDMLASLAMQSRRSSQLQGTVCPTCRLSYAEFKRTSQLGCSRCYETFASLVGPLLKQIHGSAQHVGKNHKRTVRQGSVTEELAQLKLELREAVRHERYEKAADVRDQIQKLERDAARKG